MHTPFGENEAASEGIEDHNEHIKMKELDRIEASSSMSKSDMGRSPISAGGNLDTGERSLTSAAASRHDVLLKSG